MNDVSRTSIFIFLEFMKEKGIALIILLIGLNLIPIFYLTYGFKPTGPLIQTPLDLILDKFHLSKLLSELAFIVSGVLLIFFTLFCDFFVIFASYLDLKKRFGVDDKNI